MPRLRTVAFAACCAALAPMLTALPAVAAWSSLGQVRFDDDMDHASMPGPEDRPVRALEFTARHDPAFCENVRAHFADGDEADIFSGPLAPDQSVRVDVPGERRVIERLSFHCRSRGDWTVIEVSAGTGRGDWEREHSGDDDQEQGPPQADWDQGPPRPDWDRRRPGWEGERGFDRLPDFDRWQRVGRENFQGQGGFETLEARRQGRAVDAVALRPQDADARCSRIIAEFRHGRRASLDVERFAEMERGRYYLFELPGGVRNLVALHMVCRAIGEDQVYFEIFTRRAD